MPIPNFPAFCTATPFAPNGKCITLPGGMEICANIPSTTPLSLYDYAQGLLGQLNTALGPLQPVFNILDAVIAIFDCIKAISTLDPSKIVECIPDLAAKIMELLKLIPQLSLPIMIRDFVQCLLDYLIGVRANVAQSQAYLDRINAALDATTNTDIDITAIIDCANADLQIGLDFQGQQSAPIDKLIGIINTFLQLLGLPCIPNIGTPSLDPAFLAFLDTLIEFLEFLLTLITIPIPTIPVSISAEDC